jgi:hypothetical protein
MHKSRQLLTNTKVLISAPHKALAAYYRKNRDLLGRVTNLLTILAFTIGVLALITLVWLYVRPVKTANIKVPVATDQASYYPGEEISGIFFGDTYYSGEIRVLREVFCKDYKGVIKPPAGSANGNFFSTIGTPRHLEGQSVIVGNLPENVPIGSNCVLQFTNIYDIQTPFGLRKAEYQYYTQNFSIVTRERRQQLECEASGRKDCNFIIDIPNRETGNSSITPSPQSSPESVQSPVTNNNTYNTNIPYNPTDPPTEPAPRYEERCRVDFLGIKYGCRQVQVN